MIGSLICYHKPVSHYQKTPDTTQWQGFGDQGCSVEAGGRIVLGYRVPGSVLQKGVISVALCSVRATSLFHVSMYPCASGFVSVTTSNFIVRHCGANPDKESCVLYRWRAA